MASAEMIVALLCAGSTRYHSVGGVGGWLGGRLSRPELAGLMAGMNEVQTHLALAKYALDEDSERALIASVRVWAAGLAIQQGWDIVRGRPTVANMSALAVFDVVRPNRCCRCQGRGLVDNRVCSCCSGTGYKALSGRKMAEAIGVDQSNYCRIWKGRYQMILNHVQNIDSNVNISIRSADKEGFVACL